MNKSMQIQSKKKIFQLTTMMLLSILFLVIIMVIKTSFALDGWQFSINYVDEANANSILWSTDKNENKTVRISVNYSNRTVESNYEAGELVITIPGIGDANRDKNLVGVIGADRAGSGVTNRDWTYTYNSLTNTYTFTNNKAISANTAFTGNFELVWSLNSRNTINNYNTSIKANLTGPEKGDGAGSLNLESNTITYAETRVKDEFTVSESAQSIYKTQIGTLNMDDYIFVKYNLSSTTNSKSLGLSNTAMCSAASGLYSKGIEYEITLPADVILASSTSIITDLGGNKFRVAATQCNNTFIYVAYPKVTYDGKTVINPVSLYGTYNEEDEESLLANTTISINLSDYDYINIPGDLYTFEKGVVGKYQNEADDATCKENVKVSGVIVASKKGFINGLKLGSETFTSYLGGELLATSTRKYSYEATDDFLYIALANGDLRALENNEYNFADLTIYGASSFKDINGFSILADKYTVSIYTNGTLYKTVTIGNTSQKIDLPNGTHSVSVKFNNIDIPVLNLIVPITTKLNITNLENVDTNASTIHNMSYVKIYNEAGEWVNDNYTADTYINTTNINFAAKDMDTYGYYLDRDADIIHTHERENLYYNNTLLNAFSETKGGFNTLGTISTNYTYLEDDTLEKTSIYTLLPNGLKLPNGYDSIDDIWNYATFSGGNYSSDYIAAHATPVVDLDYKGTGRTYIGFKFDFSDAPIIPTNINVKINLFLSSEDYQLYGDTYTLRSYSFIDDGDIKELYYKQADIDDIDQDGNTTETVSSSSDTKSIIYANSSQLEIQKSEKSTTTNGNYVTEGGKAGLGSIYTYKLKAEVGNNKAKNIIITDYLENESSEWQGTLESVDATFAKAMGFNPTVYYSDTTDNTGWSTTKSANTKAIKVEFGDTELEAGKSLYVLVNMKAPTDESLVNKKTNNKYEIAYTAIGQTTGVETNESVESNVVNIILAKLGDIIVKKTDDITSVSGAEFSLYKADGTLISEKLTTNSIGEINIAGLEYGNYYLVETKTPDGYVLDTTHHAFTINSAIKEITVKNERIKGTFTLTKKNSVDSNIGVSGATYTLYKKCDDTVVKTYVTDENGQITLHLPWGEEYYLKETIAPTGFNINEEIFDISFTKDTVATLITKETTDEQISGGLVTLTKYELSEDGTTKLTSTIPGVVYDLYYENDVFKGTYVTDENGEIKIGDLAIGGSYYFQEHRAALGYIKASEKLSFSITVDNLENEIVLKGYNQRKYGRLRVYKTDKDENALKDAVFAIFKKKDNSEDYEKVGEYTTDITGQINKEDLLWGEYYLQEIKSPLGYALDANKYEFVFNNSNGGSRIDIDVVNAEGTGNINLTKYNTDGTQTLSGAIYSLYKNDGTLLKTDLVTDAEGKLAISNLQWGTYYLEETTAPAGYSLSSEKVRFSINNITVGTTQEIEAYDDQAADEELTVYKKIKISDINFEHGNPSFLFELTGTEETGGGIVDPGGEWEGGEPAASPSPEITVFSLGDTHTYYQQVTLTKEYLDSYIADHPGDEYIELSVKFVKIPYGIYTLSEKDVIRYELDKVEASIGSTTNSDNSVTFTLQNGTTINDYVRITNEKEKNSELSHTSLVTNIIANRKFTALAVIYAKDGEEVAGGTVINRDDLEVYATYDDGTTRLLGNNEYTLDLTDDKVPDNQKSDLTVTASYTENGITRNGTFTVTSDFVAKFAQCPKTSIAYKLDASDMGEGIIDTESDSEQAFIEGEDPNNYLWYSGKLWRIVSMNPDDCSVKLVTQDSVSEVAYNPAYVSAFENSYIDQWLQEVFEPTLYNKDTLIADKDFNATETTDDTKPANTTMVNRTVGLLNSYEYKMSFKNTTYVNSYLNIGQNQFLISPFNSIRIRSVQTTGNIDYSNTKVANAVRPSINLLSSVQISSGNGSETNPYKIVGDISTPSSGTLLNTRISGEYVNFNGEKYRIVGAETQNGNKLTKITSYDYVKDSSNAVITKMFNTASGKIIYTPTDSSYGAAYYLNQDASGFYQNLPTNYKNMVVDGIWNLGEYADGTDYHNTTNTASGCNALDICTVTAKIGIPRATEIWTSQYDKPSTNSTDYWLLSPYNASNVRFAYTLGNLNNRATNSTTGLRSSMYLANDVKIIGGLGTKESPFEITQ